MAPKGKQPTRQEPEEDEYDDEEDYDDDVEEDEQGGRAEGDGDDDEYVELDLERTLTWTGNAVQIQAGSEFRMPLMVPHPSVLAIQFEVENGNDIEFSLTFKDDNEEESSLLVEPVRVTDREGQLDIDTTGVCEIVWSNHYAWVSQKTLSYQLQLAPKIDMLKKKWRTSIISAASDFRIMAAVTSAEKVDSMMKSLKTRKAKLQETVSSSREKEAQAQTRYDTYLGHVKRLEEEVEAAKAHAQTAKSELTQVHQDKADAERSLLMLQNLRNIDQGLTSNVMQSLQAADEPLELLFDAYAGSMYEQPQEEEDDEDGPKPATSIDRAELLHLLQDFEIVGRGEPSELFCGVFTGCGQQLSIQEFKRCIARFAVGLAADKPQEDEQGPIDHLMELLLVLPDRIERTKLTSLDVQRRFKVIQAAELIDEIFLGEEGEYEEEEYEEEEETEPEPEPEPAPEPPKKLSSKAAGKARARP
tara:strand:+ start:450 stop:1868 length:1419 start_codon:yes stop_codon:yes gene_type:complete